MWSRNGGDSSAQAAVHLPVMVSEVVSFLNLQRARLVVDGTCGEGGHSEVILRHLSSDARLLLLDRDPEILEVARMRLGGDRRVRFAVGSYADVEDILNSFGFGKCDSFLVDLGMSGYHIERGDRGFGFDSDRLDMRFNRSCGVSADEFLATASAEEIERVLREFGEERFARRVAKAIVSERKREPINSGKRLARLIERVVGRRGRIHPATRTFQALRIWVNDELEHLKRFLGSLERVLGRGARFVSIAFHSLEDRLIKRALSEYAEGGFMRILTKKVVRPTAEEVKRNPRARSARLRAAEVLL